MLKIAVLRACSVGSRGCYLHSMRQVAACNMPMLQAKSPQHTSLSSWAAHMRLGVPSATAGVTQVIRVPSQQLHGTGILSGLNDNQSPTQTQVSRIKNTDGPFSFFSFSSLFSTPAPYMLYGLGGLIPFMSAPCFMYLMGDFSPAIAHAQLVYGACILSFLGGVSWGNHLHCSDKASLESLSYSILLPLVAWPAVLLYPNPGSFLLMTAGIVYAGVKDTRSSTTYPRWFKNLRFLLSSLVALSLSTTLVFRYTLESKESSEKDGSQKVSE